MTNGDKIQGLIERIRTATDDASIETLGRLKGLDADKIQRVKDDHRAWVAEAEEILGLVAAGKLEPEMVAFAVETLESLVSMIESARRVVDRLDAAERAELNLPFAGEATVLTLGAGLPSGRAASYPATLGGVTERARRWEHGLDRSGWMRSAGRDAIG